MFDILCVTKCISYIVKANKHCFVLMLLSENIIVKNFYHIVIEK